MKIHRNESTLNTLANNVRRLRKLSGLSQEELAFQCEIDRTYISKVERGVANPSLLILSRIAEVLDVSIEELVKI
ncbi:COG1476 Predicted transcriptional regulators [Methylophilaceae bacterium]